MKYFKDTLWMLLMPMAIAGISNMLGFRAEAFIYGTVFAFFARVIFDLADIRRLLEKSK